MKFIFFRLGIVFLFLMLVSCENDAVVIEEPIQNAAVADTTG
ncbi:MAG: hypothetical protein V4635_13775 [Bacteroidota bacterium]